MCVMLLYRQLNCPKYNKNKILLFIMRGSSKLISFCLIVNVITITSNRKENWYEKLSLEFCHKAQVSLWSISMKKTSLYIIFLS